MQAYIISEMRERCKLQIPFEKTPVISWITFRKRLAKLRWNFANNRVYYEPPRTSHSDVEDLKNYWYFSNKFLLVHFPYSSENIPETWWCSSTFWRRVDSPVDASISEKHTRSSALKMEVVCFSETLASTDKSTRRQNSEQHYHPHRRENLKSNIPKTYS
jgi:hypothetical protein